MLWEGIGVQSGHQRHLGEPTRLPARSWGEKDDQDSRDARSGQGRRPYEWGA
jgi:hypothetical protein